MAKLPGQFNAEEHKDMGFDALPEAWYHIQITKSEMKLTKKAKDNNDPSLGQMLNLTLEVMDGKYKGRNVFEGLNILNPNPETAKIANETLATISRAVGFPNGLPDNDSDHLHHKPFDAKLGVVKGTGGYPDKNKIVSVKQYGTQEVDTSGGSSGGSVSTPSAGKVKLDEVKSSPKKEGNVW